MTVITSQRYTQQNGPALLLPITKTGEMDRTLSKTHSVTPRCLSNSKPWNYLMKLLLSSQIQDEACRLSFPDCQILLADNSQQ